MKDLVEAAKRFVELGNDGVFMTCEGRIFNDMNEYTVKLHCVNFKQAHKVHEAIIDIVERTREIA